MEQVNRKSTSPVVSVIMPTYNHARYIKLAIESALAQRTSFDFELLIHDDCSTDETLEIARSFEKQDARIRLFTEEKNTGLIRSYKTLLEHSRGRYIAILESDDYFIDPLKLEKQVSYMEQHLDTAFTCGDIIGIDENGREIQHGGYNKEKYDNPHLYESMLGGRGIYGSCTVMYRKESLDKFINIDDYVRLGFLTFDQPTYLTLLAEGQKVYFFREILSAYRFVSTSQSNTSDLEKSIKFWDNVIMSERYVTGKYGLGRLSRSEYNNRSCEYENRICDFYMAKALKNHVFSLFVSYSNRLTPLSVKQFFMRYFPHVYYYQFILRHRKEQEKERKEEEKRRYTGSDSVQDSKPNFDNENKKER